MCDGFCTLRYGHRPCKQSIIGLSIIAQWFGHEALNPKVGPCCSMGGWSRHGTPPVNSHAISTLTNAAKAPAPESVECNRFEKDRGVHTIDLSKNNGEEEGAASSCPSVRLFQSFFSYLVSPGCRLLQPDDSP